MNVAACQILRHPVRMRHGLGVPATWCDCCGIDFPTVPDPAGDAVSTHGITRSAGAPTSHPDLSVEVGHEGTPRSSVSHLDRGAELATQPA